MADGGIGEAALYSALIGGGTSAVMGGDPLKGAAMGALTGGLTSGVLGAMSGAGASAGSSIADASAGSSIMGGGTTPPPAYAPSAGAQVPSGVMNFADPSAQTLSAASNFTAPIGQDAASALSYTPPSPTTSMGPDFNASAAGTPIGLNASGAPLNPLDAQNFSEFLRSGKTLGAMQLGMTGVGAGLGELMKEERNRYKPPGQTQYKGMLTDYVPTAPAQYNRASAYLPMYAAQGGIMELPTTKMASGGISSLGGYSDGGRMLKGPGDGMSDSIPATIGGRQPARLAEGEFVVPADVVSHLGNGSTDAGAKQLYTMMDRVRKARTGTKKQGREIKPSKYVPA
jgi:hypothetical protein